MASTPIGDLLINGAEPTAITGWETLGGVTVANKKFRLAPGASMKQFVNPHTLPDSFQVSIQGSFPDTVLPGEHPGQVILTASGDADLIRIILLPETVGGQTFNISERVDFTYPETVILQWEVSVKALQTMEVSSIKVSPYLDTGVEAIRGDLAEKYSTLNRSIDGISYIVGVNKQTTDTGLADLKTTIDITAEGLNAAVSRVDNRMDGEVASLNSSLALVAGQINLKADSSTVNSLGTRLSSAEVNINGAIGQIQSKVSQTDYNGSTIASLINQTAYSVKIQASKIELVGAVSVLSDITGALGNISSGNIDIYNDIKVGNNIYLNGSGSRGLYFDRWGATGSITSDGSQMRIYSDSLILSSMYGVDLPGTVNFNPSFSLNGVVKSFTNGLEITRNTSDSRLLTAKVNGTYIGNLQLTGI